MHSCKRTVTMVGLLGLVALVGAGCSKSIQADAGSKSFEPAPQAKQEGTGSSAGQKGQDAPVSQFGSLPGDTGSAATERAGSEKAGSERAGKGGEEPVSESIAVAKAAPSDASGSSRQQEMQQEAAATAAAGLDDVFFTYDSWKLSEDGKHALSKNAEWLKANGSQKLAVEGHCDERGTQAYNLVLGQKRAKAIRNYLVELGVAGNRITVVSYGKDRPFCRESNESCYQQNRRGHLVVSDK